MCVQSFHAKIELIDQIETCKILKQKIFPTRHLFSDNIKCDKVGIKNDFQIFKN